MKNWIRQIDEMIRDVDVAFGQADPSLLVKRPEPDQWSVAENLNHLIRFNESYYPQIHSQLAGNRTAPWIARIPGLATLTKRMLHHFLRPENRRRMKTMKPWIPGDLPPAEEVVSRFVKHQAALKQVIESAAPLIKQSSRVHSPASRWIVYDLEGAFDMIMDHQRRHLQQAKRALDSLTTPTEQTR